MAAVVMIMSDPLQPQPQPQPSSGITGEPDRPAGVQTSPSRTPTGIKPDAHPAGEWLTLLDTERRQLAEEERGIIEAMDSCHENRMRCVLVVRLRLA